MNIVHVSLASSFTPGLTYQDNMMAEQNVRDGQNVTMITNCSKFIGGKLCDVEPEDIVLENGIRLIRVKYDNVFNNSLAKKLRKVTGLSELLQELKPDVIMHHGINDYELLTVAEYKRSHPDIKLYCDTHADYYTSGTNMLSRIVLHRGIYKHYINKAKAQIDKIFYVSEGCRVFAKEIYGLQDSDLEFLPLGGQILAKEEVLHAAESVRAELNLKEGELLFVHAGKMDAQKKTIGLLKAFQSVKRGDFKLALVGELDGSIKEQALALISQDDRIVYLGWKSGTELLGYLNAADLYIQPGKVSAIAQNALCARCAVILNKLPDYEVFVNNNGFLVKGAEEITDIIESLTHDDLDKMKEASGVIANQLLDYKTISARIYR